MVEVLVLQQTVDPFRRRRFATQNAPYGHNGTTRCNRLSGNTSIIGPRKVSRLASNSATGSYPITSFVAIVAMRFVSLVAMGGIHL